MPRKEWLKLGKPESDLTDQVVKALRAAGFVAWQAKKRGGVKANDTSGRIPDVIGFAPPDGRLFSCETKRSHAASCKCESCEGQRKWGARLIADGGVYVPNCRSVAAAVEGVTQGLAVRRKVA